MTRIIALELDGSIPSKKNNKQISKNIRTGTRFLRSSDNYRKWHGGACLQINLQKGSIRGVDFPIKKCDYIQVTLFYGDHKRRDNTNLVESIHDLLVDAGVLEDDNWQRTGRTIQIPEFREKNPGAEIIIAISNSGKT